jgi:hypothetical protein
MEIYEGGRGGDDFMKTIPKKNHLKKLMKLTYNVLFLSCLQCSAEPNA